MAKIWVVIATAAKLLYIVMGLALLMVEQDGTQQSTASAPDPAYSRPVESAYDSQLDIRRANWDKDLEQFVASRPDFFDEGRNASAFESVIEEYKGAIGAMDNRDLLQQSLDLAQQRLSAPPPQRRAAPVMKVHSSKKSAASRNAGGSEYGLQRDPDQSCPNGTERIGNQCCTPGGWIKNEGGSETMVSPTCS